MGTHPPVSLVPWTMVIAAAPPPYVQDCAAAREQLAAELRGVPPRVRAHYARTLLAWTSGALLKARGVVGQSTQRQQGPGGAGNEDNPGADPGVGPGLAPAAVLWDLLAALLRSPDVPAAGGANAALVEAAARACGALRGGGACLGRDGSTAAVEALAAALLRALRVLSAKFGRFCRPSLEHRCPPAQCTSAGHSLPHTACYSQHILL